MEDGQQDGTVLNLIGAGVMAGAYRSLARKVPEAREGLLKMANKHHERGTALMAEMCDRQAEALRRLLS